MPRILFTKTGEAIWMSHLDLMRLFQRAFKRAGLPLTHTQGFNPRPSVSIALPLSVGVESVCELLDFDLTGERVSCQEITQRLNRVLVPGIQVLETYDNGRKIKDLAYLACAVTLEYDHGVPSDAVSALERLFARDALPVEKKSKNGVKEQDLIPMMRQTAIEQVDDHTIEIRVTVTCQNPSMNPMQMVTAVERYLPEYMPDFAKSQRMEVYDINMKEFR